MTDWLHGTAVALGRRGVLILGATGSGKSSLALELIAGGATLISDDRIGIESAEDGVLLHAHSNGYGQIEARGLGIIQGPWVDHAPLHLVVDLDRGVSERLPDPQFWEFDGHSVRLLPGQDVVALRHVVLLVLRGDYDCRTP